MEISAMLEEKAAKLRREGLGQMKLALMGTKTENLLHELEMHFGDLDEGSEEDMEAEERLEAENEPDSVKPGEAYQIESCKVCFPSEKDKVATDVPEELIPKHIAEGNVSSYPCLWNGCDAKPQQKRAAWIHLRKYHLGSAFCCPYHMKEGSALGRWFDFIKWEAHMKKEHPDVPHYGIKIPLPQGPVITEQPKPSTSSLEDVAGPPASKVIKLETVVDAPDPATELAIIHSLETARKEDKNRGKVKSSKS